MKWGPSLALAACLLWSAAAQADSEESLLYVARRGWHIDIGVAADDLKPPLAALPPRFDAARYVFFGFGDRRYLLSKHRSSPALAAALWPGRGLMLVTALPSSPAEAFGSSHVVAIHVSARAQRQALEFVAGSFAARAPLTPVASGPYEGSLYFDATPVYSAAHTCNTWVAEVLRAAAQPIRVGGVIFASQLWSQVRRLQRIDAAAQAATSSLYRQGGLVPSWQTTVVEEPWGTTTVVFSGGGGLLLLMQPDNIQAAARPLTRTFISTPLKIEVGSSVVPSFAAAAAVGHP